MPRATDTRTGTTLDQYGLPAGAGVPIGGQVSTNTPAPIYTSIPNYAGLTSAESANIGHLLSPTDFYGTQQHAAEANAAGGVSGSPFGDLNTARLTEEEKIRRELLGSQLLTGAISRLTPYIPRTDTSTRFGQPGAPAGPVFARGGPTPGGPGAPATPSPGQMPPMGILGTSPNKNPTLDWLQQIISGGPATPLSQIPSSGSPIGGGSMFMGDIDPETGLPLNQGLPTMALDTGEAGTTDDYYAGYEDAY